MNFIEKEIRKVKQQISEIKNKKNNVILDEISMSPQENENIEFENIVSDYFLQLITILDLKKSTMSKSYRGKDLIVKKMIPKLLEFLPQLTRPQFIKFFKQAFIDFNLSVTEEDFDDIVYSIRKFEAKRQNIISKKTSDRKDVEFIDDLSELINDIRNNKLTIKEYMSLYDAVYKNEENYDVTNNVDVKKIQINKIFDEISDFTIKMFDEYNFNEFYKDKRIQSVLKWIDENIDSPNLISFKNKSLAKLLLKMGFNIKTNPILKNLFMENETAIIRLNKKRLLLVFVEIFTQLYYPNGLINGLKVIEKELKSEFLIKTDVRTLNIPDENVSQTFINVNKNDDEIETEIKKQKDDEKEAIRKQKKDELKKSTSNILSIIEKPIGIGNIKKMFMAYTTNELYFEESGGMIEVIVPVDRFTAIKPESVEFENQTFEPNIFVKKFESREIEYSIESYILYLKAKGLYAEKYFRFSFPKSFTPEFEDEIEVLRELLLYSESNMNFIEVKIDNYDFKISRENPIPEIVLIASKSSIKSFFDKYSN